MALYNAEWRRLRLLDTIGDADIDNIDERTVYKMINMVSDGKTKETQSGLGVPTAHIV